MASARNDRHPPDEGSKDEHQGADYESKEKERKQYTRHLDTRRNELQKQMQHARDLMKKGKQCAEQLAEARTHRGADIAHVDRLEEQVHARIDHIQKFYERVNREREGLKDKNRDLLKQLREIGRGINDNKLEMADLERSERIASRALREMRAIGNDNKARGHWSPFAKCGPLVMLEDEISKGQRQEHSGNVALSSAAGDGAWLSVPVLGHTPLPGLMLQQERQKLIAHDEEGLEDDTAHDHAEHKAERRKLDSDVREHTDETVFLHTCFVLRSPHPHRQVQDQKDLQNAYAVLNSLVMYSRITVLAV
jgi:hypothetical protein